MIGRRFCEEDHEVFRSAVREFAARIQTIHGGTAGITKDVIGRGLVREKALP
ncbi:hypothetical protein [Microbispora sp. NPDC046933]|uniref:hypothetical protein n=1 Tax=Microbispora sp. NPDC046933 TaxID=3155618 RepID=UPI0033CA72D0